MKSFIILTFAFLGFAFYEMSGGADFQPASARAGTVDQRAQAEVDTAPAPVAPVETAALEKSEGTPEVTRVSLNLTTVRDAAEQATAEPVTEPVAEARISAPSTQSTVQKVSFSQGSVSDSSETPRIILPSLIATTSEPQAPRGDIRTVTGNRVNVRGGPSTSYGVVGKLTRGEAVRVLDDNGNGWVLMEAVEGGAEGWMADFLLTSG